MVYGRDDIKSSLYVGYTGTGDFVLSGEDTRVVWCKIGSESICQASGDVAWSMAGAELLLIHDEVVGHAGFGREGRSTDRC